MYISRCISRMAALLVSAGLVSVISRLTIGDDDLMMRYLAVFAVLVLVVLALGQLQNAYNLLRVSRLLRKVVYTNKSYTLGISGGAKAHITLHDGYYYQVKVVEYDSLDVVTYTITPKMITATKKTPAGVLVPIPGERSSDLSKMTFDERPFSPDYRKELQRLKDALQVQLPRYGRFTP